MDNRNSSMSSAQASCANPFPQDIVIPCYSVIHTADNNMTSSVGKRQKKTPEQQGKCNCQRCPNLF